MSSGPSDIAALRADLNRLSFQVAEQEARIVFLVDEVRALRGTGAASLAASEDRT